MIDEREFMDDTSVGDKRRWKRWLRQRGSDDQLESAYNWGAGDYVMGKGYHNPYPLGKRHDNYWRGYNSYGIERATGGRIRDGRIYS